MYRSALCLIALLLAGCGKSNPNADGGASAGCAISTGAVTISTSGTAITSDTLQCMGTIGNTTLTCNAAATLSRAECSDGYAFALTSESTTLYIRMQATNGNWAAGAQFPGGAPLTGDISFNGLQSPDVLPPTPGPEVASFEVEGTGTEATVTANGTLTTTW